MPRYVCPTCQQLVAVEHAADAPYRPFCSKRCQLIDLHHWFAGDYVISDPLLPDPDEPLPEQHSNELT